MKIKQIISNLLIVTIILSTLVGCGTTKQIEPNSETTENIVTETEISETTITEVTETDWSKEYENYFVKKPIDLYHSTL